MFAEASKLCIKHKSRLSPWWWLFMLCTWRNRMKIWKLCSLTYNITNNIPNNNMWGYDNHSLLLGTELFSVSDVKWTISQLAVTTLWQNGLARSSPFLGKSIMKMIHSFTHRKYTSFHVTSKLNWWQILFQSRVYLDRLTVFVAELPSNRNAKSKEEMELMNDRNINKFLEGTYTAVCEALNWSL